MGKRDKERERNGVGGQFEAFLTTRRSSCNYPILKFKRFTNG